MSIIDDALSAIIRGANPDTSPEDVMAQVNQLKQSGGEAVDQALSFIPGLKDLKDAAANIPALATEAAQTPTGASIASALSGGPVAANVPNPGNPVSDVANGVVSGVANALAIPPSPQPAPVTPPTAPPVVPPPAVAATPSPMSKANSPMPATPPPPALPDVVPTSKDNDARQAALDDAAKKRKEQIIPEAIAGAGDAVGKGLAAFGIKTPTDQQDKLLERAKANFEESKGLFEDKVKNDPNSDISKSYRQMVLQIAPDLAKNPNFTNMSAAAIGDKLPLIDTMVKAQASKDAKEMGLKQLQANHDISLGLKQDQQQDKLEQQYKQQLMSVRGDPNISGLEKQRDGAAQAYNILAQSRKSDGSYDLSEPQLTELYNQISVATSGKGMTDSMQKAMDQSTAKQKLASIATFVGMSPSATTQAIGDRLMHMSTVLGQQTQGNLDRRMESRILPPSGLDPERVEPIKKAGRGFSFQDLVQKSNERAQSNVPQESRKTQSGITYREK